MAQTITYHQLLTPILASHIEFLIAQRKLLQRNHNDKRIGINYSLILSIACLVEGSLESQLFALYSHRSRLMHAVDHKDFYSRRVYNTSLSGIDQHIEGQIEKLTGIDGFSGFFEMLSYMRLPAKLTDYKDYEGIKVLFQLRNMLAHGRMVRGSKKQAWYIPEPWLEDFKGGFKAAEKYLHKRRIVRSKFLQHDTIRHILSNQSADHFWKIARGFLRHVSGMVETETKHFDSYDPGRM